MVHPPVVTVDQDDTIIGEMPLSEARATGTIYRVVFVVVVDGQGRYLLQKRSQHMVLFPGRWDAAAGGHVDGGHSYEEAARLELAEEVGVHDVPLTQIAHFYTDMPLMGIASKRYVTVYRVNLDVLPKQPEGDEVAELRWFTVDEIASLVREHPELVAEGLQHLWDKVLA